MRTILHAEDDETIAQLVEIAIEKTPGVYVLVRRDNGAKAFAYLDVGNPVDLLITDWNMPEMDGLELVRKIRADARFATLPIVFTSSMPDQELQQALAAGANLIVRKPFDVAELKRAIESLLHVP
jgi:two-component system chemotaxis response regulator CheY